MYHLTSNSIISLVKVKVGESERFSLNAYRKGRALITMKNAFINSGSESESMCNISISDSAKKIFSTTICCLITMENCFFISSESESV